jgi:hypothetical protein
MKKKATVFIKPRKGLIVRDPVSFTPLSEKGEIKPLIGKEGRYWRKRLNCGDAVIVEQRQSKFDTPTKTQKNKSGGIE